MPLSKIRKTKIVATIGPVTATPEMLKSLVDVGMDVARLNFSHGDHDSHRAVLHEVRRLAKEAGRPVGVLMDLAGPKIRLGDLKAEVALKPNDTVILAPGDHQDGDVLPVNYQHLLEDVEVGGRILLADGLVELVVGSKEPRGLRCTVINGGVISSRKGVNLPTSVLRIPAFTEKDKKDLEMGLSEGVDFVALSFVRHEQDLEPVREIISGLKRRPLLIAKIEKPQALDRLAEILAVVDGVMVARGDLGVEIPFEDVPIAQKKIIDMARRAGKVVITATQMLRSMINSPRPSRAEATDVANAVFDGTDAVMLSDETAAGSYPIDAVRVMDRICLRAEQDMDSSHYLRQETSPLVPPTEAALSKAVVYLARDLCPAAIVASTSGGGTARLISRYRPRIAIVGLTPNRHVYNQLSMSWGVLPALDKHVESTDAMFQRVSQWCREKGIADKGQRLIITAGVPLGQPGTTNMIRITDV